MAKLSLKEIKSLLALADKHNLTSLSVNGLTLGRSYVSQPTKQQLQKPLDESMFDNLPTTIEELDAPILKMMKPYMES